MTAYRAICLQMRCQAVTRARDRAEARAVMRQSLERLRGQVTSGVAFVGEDCQLVVLPEYFLTGFPLGDPISITVAGYNLSLRLNEADNIFVEELGVA